MCVYKILTQKKLCLNITITHQVEKISIFTKQHKHSKIFKFNELHICHCCYSHAQVLLA